MKKNVLFWAIGLLCLGVLGAMDDIQVGRVNIPKPFVHQEQEFAPGAYQITLSEKEGIPVFLVNDNQNNLLFEELAVIKPYEGKGKNFKPRVRKAFLKDFEYFRIKVTTPENIYLAYFLMKK